jgi:beta-carotene ketolase (CrtO type)
VLFSRGRASTVLAAGRQFKARRAVVSAIDARRLFLELCPATALSADLLREVRRIHVGLRNVSELKVDAVIERLPRMPGPAGFERSFMLSPNTTTEIERAFAAIELGRLPGRPPLMIAFPSTLEEGWAPDGRAVAWVSTFVPWRLESGEWDAPALEQAADHTWAAVERALGERMVPVSRRLTGPPHWVARHGNPHANPNHVEMSIDQLLAFRPSPSLAGYRTPIAGLYLTGAGTHPGGGVTGIPGRNAAAVIASDLRVAPRRPTAQQLREKLATLTDAARAARALGRAA